MSDDLPSKRIVKLIKKRLEAIGCDIKTSHCYEALAIAYGYRDWNDAVACSIDSDIIKALTVEPKKTDLQATN